MPSDYKSSKEQLATIKGKLRKRINIRSYLLFDIIVLKAFNIWTNYKVSKRGEADWLRLRLENSSTNF